MLAVGWPCYATVAGEADDLPAMFSYVEICVAALSTELSVLSKRLVSGLRNICIDISAMRFARNA